MDKVLTATLATIPQVHNQVYPLVADESATGAYIVYERTKTTNINTLDGDTGCQIVTYDIHALAQSYADCVTLSDAIKTACKSMAGEQSGSLSVQSVDIIGDSPQEYARDIGVYRCLVQISCFISIFQM